MSEWIAEQLLGIPVPQMTPALAHVLQMKEKTVQTPQQRTSERMAEWTMPVADAPAMADAAPIPAIESMALASRHGRCGTCSSDRVRGACFRVPLHTCSNEGRRVSPRLLRDLPGWRHRLTGGEGDFIAKQITDVPAPQIAGEIAEEQAAPTLAATFAAPHLMQEIGEAVQPTLQETTLNCTLAEETGAMGKSFPKEIFGIPRPLPWKKSLEAVKVLQWDVHEEFLDPFPVTEQGSNC